VGRDFGNDARDDEAPVGEVWLAEGLIVGEVGNHKQLGRAGATGDQIAGHLHGKQAVFLSMDDDHRQGAGAQGFAG